MIWCLFIRAHSQACVFPHNHDCNEPLFSQLSLLTFQLACKAALICGAVIAALLWFMLLFVSIVQGGNIVMVSVLGGNFIIMSAGPSPTTPTTP